MKCFVGSFSLKCADHLIQMQILPQHHREGCMTPRRARLTQMGDASPHPTPDPTPSAELLRAGHRFPFRSHL